MQALRVVSGDEVYIPLILHALCAGFPSPADDYIEGEIDLNRHLIANRPATFLFRVAGDCMRDAGIFDGDLLIVDRSLTPKHGDVVVVFVEGERSVKRLLIEDGQPRLVFETRDWPAYPVPHMADVEIWGVAEFVARIRRLASGEGGRRWTNPSDDPGSPMPFKANAARRHRIPKQRRRVTNWAEYDAALRQRGSLTVWFSEEAIAAWHAEPRTTPGGQPHYSDLAITTALTLKAVFRLALRQTEGLIGSVIGLLGLDLAVPDHTTLSRRAETLEVPRPRSDSRTDAGRDPEPVHLLVDSTGLKLCGAGEWLVEKHGTRTRRAWRKMHVGTDADTGQIVASELTTNDVDDGTQVGPLLDQVDGQIDSFTGDGAYARAGV